MKPRNRNRRLTLLGLGALGLGGAALLTFTALSQNLDYFYSPEDIELGKAPQGKRIRLGGVVAEGSVRNSDGVGKIFEVTDGAANITVQYDGLLPDLFREGQGVIAQGRLQGQLQGQLSENMIFQADIILAKHDENYKPKELKGVLDKAGGARPDPTKPGTTYR